jgi:hypothetical protein
MMSEEPDLDEQRTDELVVGPVCPTQLTKHARLPSGWLRASGCGKWDALIA